MTNEQITIITVYLGIGGVYFFWGDYNEVISELVEELHEDSPNLPLNWIKTVAAISIMIGIVIWPWFAVYDVVSWYRHKRSN